MNETSQTPSLTKVVLGKKIKIVGFVENFLGKRIWYDFVIVLDERYLEEDLKGFAKWYLSNYPTITSVRIEDLKK